MGLSSVWLQIADMIGYDTFVAIWRFVDAQPELRDDSNQIALTLRQYRTFERYQRNRYVETLVVAGLNASQIHAMVNKELREGLTFRHVKRLIAQANVKA